MRTTLHRLLVAAVLVSFAGTGAACSAPDDVPSHEGRVASAEESADVVTQMIDVGLTEIAAGKERAAAGTFAKVLDIDPENVFGLYNTAFLAQRAGDEKRAAELYTVTLGVDPEFAPAIYNLALLTEPVDLMSAISLYHRLLQVTPRDPAAHMRLGFALERVGDLVGGRRHLRTAVRLDPSLADVEAPRYE